MLWPALVLAALHCHAQAEPAFREDLEKELFARANQERTQRGLPAYRWNDRLNQSARAHALKLGEYRMLSHQFKDEPPLAVRISATELHFSAAAENIGLSTEPLDVHEGWMESAGHRANILSTEYDSLGVAVFRRGDYFYAVQNFARAGEDLTPEGAMRVFVQALNTFRRRKGMPRVIATYSGRIREAVCKMANNNDKPIAPDLPTGPNDHGMTAFTTPEPEVLTAEMQKFALNAEFASIRVGVCFQVSKANPGGTYWFGVVF
ncbi:MAG: CAP domain-containing protein [Acidobacteriales bacterium]|nr:CAP domain-containing protein [Terriglobales bacterium]